MRTVLEAASERVLITDCEGTILYVNPAFERVTGYTKAEVIGKNPRILKSGKHSRRFYEEFWSILLEGYPFRSRFLNKKKDGTWKIRSSARSGITRAGLRTSCPLPPMLPNESPFRKSCMRERRYSTASGGRAGTVRNALQQPSRKSTRC